MRTLLRVTLLSLPCLLSAQQWEVGASAGYGFLHQATVTNGSVSGTTGFASGFAAGALLGNQINRWVGGEARYTFRSDDLQVKSGSSKASAAGQSHAIHYDLLIHAAPTKSPIRPFVAVGAGVKIYRGTGTEPAFQPLGNLVLLTHTREAQPLISAGGGVKFAAGKRALIRLDLRDYMTPMPTSLLTAAPGARINGWVHDFVFLVGVSSTF